MAAMKLISADHYLHCHLRKLVHVVSLLARIQLVSISAKYAMESRTAYWAKTKADSARKLSYPSLQYAPLISSNAQTSLVLRTHAFAMGSGTVLREKMREASVLLKLVSRLQSAVLTILHAWTVRASPEIVSVMSTKTVH
jgi:hypothetical protein